jgi:hypothetical protein
VCTTVSSLRTALRDISGPEFVLVDEVAKESGGQAHQARTVAAVEALLNEEIEQGALRRPDRQPALATALGHGGAGMDVSRPAGDHR